MRCKPDSQLKKTILYRKRTKAHVLFGMPLLSQMFDIAYIYLYDMYKNKIHINNTIVSIFFVSLATQSVNHNSLKNLVNLFKTLF